MGINKKFLWKTINLLYNKIGFEELKNIISNFITRSMSICFQWADVFYDVGEAVFSKTIKHRKVILLRVMNNGFH